MLRGAEVHLEPHLFKYREVVFIELTAVEAGLFHGHSVTSGALHGELAQVLGDAGHREALVPPIFHLCGL